MLDQNLASREHCTSSPITKSQALRALVGATNSIQNVREHISMVAPSDAPVLVQGETGTGKELAAKAIHCASNRSGEFVAVNCAAIPAELLESELFGHEKGSFTGATERKIGRIEQADGGTLFLDEIGDMPLDLQVKLLRVLETKMLRRVGGSEERAIDFRLVSATHRNLTPGAQDVPFRDDLFFRIAVFQINIPALRERTSDIPLILERMLEEMDLPTPPHFDPSAIRALAAHPWVGNVRELRNVLVRATVLFNGRMITGEIVRASLLNGTLSAPSTDSAAVMPESVGMPRPESFVLDEDKAAIDMRVYLRDIEIALIQSALEHTDGCVSQAANRLRLRRTTLIEKMKKYGLSR
ncbi:sigma-54 dependent transcriptional regulator [Marivivens sp. LCG002]|uniref:sigma-54 interaction domain-containing protein n=1 Tax=Marivivens sp. LCG002 TaxID=3051171 RepID=UPI0025535B19|nr:sigma-54 dependent transcriptional regulator [Marivivens sp. LCG002]WIV51271.1 sigma-54 dependent transcriptional regulator [Marivivens sp. LCG002]